MLTGRNWLTEISPEVNWSMAGMVTQFSPFSWASLATAANRLAGAEGMAMISLERLYFFFHLGSDSGGPATSTLCRYDFHLPRSSSKKRTGRKPAPGRRSISLTRLEPTSPAPTMATFSIFRNRPNPPAEYRSCRRV